MRMEEHTKLSCSTDSNSALDFSMNCCQDRFQFPADHTELPFFKDAVIFRVYSIDMSSEHHDLSNYSIYARTSLLSSSNTILSL